MKTQLDKFKGAARDLETDDDEKRFDERLAKIVRRTPRDRTQDATETRTELSVTLPDASTE